MVNGNNSPASVPPAAEPAATIGTDPAGAFARAQALEERGQVAEAETIYRSLLGLYPEHPTLLQSLALALKARGQLTEAESLMRRSIALSPRDAAFHNNLGNLLRAKGNLREAEPCYRQAIALKPHYPEAHYNFGVALNELGRADESLTQFQIAVSQNPNYVQALTCIGAHYVQSDAFEEALVHIDTALALRADYFDANYYRGLALSGLERNADATAALERALAIKPDSAQVLANLALVAARRRELTRARDYATRALALDPLQVIAEIALAMADLKGDEFVAAEQRLRRLLGDPGVTGNTRGLVFGLLGDALDGQGRVADAFVAYTSENNELRQFHAARFARGRYRGQIERLIADFELTQKEDWSAPHDNRSADGAALQHVFLVGFMRSGTTLLEQVLAAHPAVITLEERDVFRQTTEPLAQLARLDGDEIVQLRAAYWQNVRNFGLEVEGKVFLDKHPLNTLKIPLIAKMFPKAKILFAIRDPRDVVFSCFRRHFGTTAASYELLTLEGATGFYDGVMRLAKLYREKVPLELRMHRYEDMVADFEANIRSVCQFIGITWVPAMQDFAEKARARAIRSMSAAQVRRGLYREGMDQWRRYAKELAPVLPKLQPWVEEFGYATATDKSRVSPSDRQ